MRIFLISILFTIFGLSLAYHYAGIHGLSIAIILVLLEISFSFDNAVLNASILKTMNPVWQQRFLTWGILVAVIFVRIIFPILLVSLTSENSFFETVDLAMNNTDKYREELYKSHISISSFGGCFLLTIFVAFLFDHKKEIFWIKPIENKLSKIGYLNSIEIIVIVSFLLYLTHFYISPEYRYEALSAGLFGIILHTLLSSLTKLLRYENLENVNKKISSGLISFIYLEILDASFSLDGVIGAFAITKDIFIMMIGLMIGAVFVRSITIFLVRKNTLDKYIFLEHGAHYAIGSLGCIMIINLFYHIPEIITGLIGISVIMLSLISSILHKRIETS